jgi:hypothetical protein
MVDVIINILLIPFLLAIVVGLPYLLSITERNLSNDGGCSP